MLNRTPFFALVLLSITVQQLPAQRRSSGGGRSQNTPQDTLVIHGSVRLPDNVPAHRIVRLEQVCGGRAAGLAFPDSKGHYSYNLGIIVNPVTGVAAVGGRTITSYADCSIRASLEGFRAQPVAIAPLLKSSSRELPPIVLEPIAKDQKAILSATDAEAGAGAKKDYQRALDLVSGGKWRDAIKAMQKVTSEEPKFATAWLSLGMLQVSQNEIDNARKSFTKAVEADEKFATPYIELAVLETAGSEWEKVAEHSDKAISLDADAFPRAYYLSTMANIRLKKIAAALKSATEGMRVDPDHAYPDLQYMAGLLMINSGNRSRGKTLLESYLEIAPNGDNVDNARAQLKTVAEGK